VNRSLRPLDLLAPIAVLAALTACSGADAATAKPGLLDVTATDFSYSVAGTGPVPSGLVELRLHNSGTQPHQAAIARLHDGVSSEQFGAALHADEAAALQLVDFEGGVGAVDHGVAASAYSTLTPGSYELVCFVQGADRVPHVAKGMFMPFRVGAPAHRTSNPRTVGVVGLRDFGFDLPSGFGRGTYAVTNHGDEAHELTILRVADGRTAEEALNFLEATTPASGPPPFSEAGGLAPISPGVTAFGVLALPPGRYLALCFVPGKTTHLPHFAMGMSQSFTVE